MTTHDPDTTFDEELLALLDQQADDQPQTPPQPDWLSVDRDAWMNAEPGPDWLPLPDDGDDTAGDAPAAPERKRKRKTKKRRQRPVLPDRTPEWPPLTRTGGPELAQLVAAAEHLARTVDLAPGDPAGLPTRAQLILPGDRRAARGRGGATGRDVTMRLLIRAPWIPVLALLFPRLTGRGTRLPGRPGMPAEFYIFYMAYAREVCSFEQADQDIVTHYYSVIVPEFLAIGVELPRLNARSIGYEGYCKWRKRHVINAGKLDPLLRVFTILSLRVHVAIARARQQPEGTMLAPLAWQLLCCDATVLHPPSKVHLVCPTCGPRADLRSCWHDPGDYKVVGSRAKSQDRARVHAQGGDHSNVKAHGPTKGLYHVAVTAQNPGMYGRMVLGLEVAQDAEAEMDLSMPLLGHVLTLAGQGWVQGLAYDGLNKAKHQLELLQQYGMPVINHNAAKASHAPTGDDPDLAGTTERSRGKLRGKPISTYAYHLATATHRRGDGGTCHHHLISDDGTVYEVASPGKPGDSARGVRKQRRVPLVDMPRTQRPDGTWDVSAVLSVRCAHGDVELPVTLTDSTFDKDGFVPATELIRTVRHITDTDPERFAVGGVRNNVEGYFSWAQQRYYHVDRVSSWGREAQLLDWLGASILCNAETWMHAITDLRAGRSRWQAVDI